MSKAKRSNQQNAAGDSAAEYVDRSQLFVEIGVGGTGKEALLQHREDPGIAESKTIKTLFVDTDAAELEDIPQEDKLLLTDYAAMRHFQELAENPDRFPHQELTPFVDSFRRAMGRAKDISTGLMTHRRLGRPLLDYYATRMFAMLAAFFLMPVRKLHAYANEACVQDFQGNIQERMRLTICLVLSVCGGTGSSVGQLLLYLLEYLLLHQGGFTRYHLEVDLFLPGVLESQASNPDLLRANAQAVFKENLAAITRKLSEFQLGTVKLSRELPARFLYLFDNINVLGHVLETRKQVTQMRNATWDLRCRGVSGREYRSLVVNIHLEAPAIYSAAGAAKFVYDVVHALTVMGYRTGQAVVLALMQPLSAEAVATAVNDWWNLMSRKFPGLATIPAYQTTVAGAPLRLVLKAVMAAQPRSRMGVAVIHAIQRGQSDWVKAFAALKQQTVTARGHLLIEQISALLNTAGGFDVAKAVLAKLLVTYQQQAAEVQEQLDLSKPPHERIRERLQQTPTHWWQRWTWNPRGDYIDSHQRYLDSLLNLVRLQAQLETLTQLIEVVQKLENQRQQLLATLSGLAERLEVDFQTYLRQYQLHQSVAVHSVVCADELNGWYEDGAKQAQAQMLAGLKIVWFAEEGEFGLERNADGITSEGKLAILSRAGIARHLEQAQLPWQHLREFSVEQLLTRRGLNPMTVYAEMEQLSAPWVSLNDVKVVPASTRLLILTTQTDDFFHDLPMQPGVSVVASGNPYEMTMLTTWHGIDPLDHLTKSEDHERAYQQAVAAGRSLHLFPETFGDDGAGGQADEGAAVADPSFAGEMS